MVDASGFVFLHGGGQGGWVWDETVQVLKARGARALALDIPGCGTKRAQDTSELGPESVADELLADITAAGLSDIILVGHSQAGTLLPLMWQRQGGLISKLVYLSCCAPLQDQSVVDMMGQGVWGAHPDQVGWPLDPALHDRATMRPILFCNDMTEDQTRAFMVRQDMDNWPLAVTFAAGWQYVHLKDVPSTYIICERDGILPPDWQHRFATRLQCDRIVSIDAGHQAMTTQPVQLASLLLDEAGMSV